MRLFAKESVIFFIFLLLTADRNVLPDKTLQANNTSDLRLFATLKRG